MNAPDSTGSGITRTERDSFGPIEVPAARLWGAQTQRALEHFAVSVERMPPELVQAVVRVKRAAALANGELRLLEPAKARAIVAAADEVLAGQHPHEFPLTVWQTGSGTQTNMNVNEVLANRASELLGGPRGNGRRVHANDEVNLGQSSNDVFPTAMHVAVALMLAQRLRPALVTLRRTLEAKADAFGGIVKIGRTHLQDATPLTLGQEFSGYVAQLDIAEQALSASEPAVLELAIGGTAVGTGLNAHPHFGERVAALLAEDTGLPFICAANRFAALAGHEPLLALHGALKTLAAALTKLANDVRWLASGPRAGLGELAIPENEPCSSIMPGKVNPTQCEMLTMVAAQVFGNDVALNIGGAGGHFELNVYKPLIAYNLLQSLRLLADGMASFDVHCARGIEAQPDRIADLLHRSLMLVTALTPHIGYDKAAAIAQDAHARALTWPEASAASRSVSAADFDRWVQPRAMLGPRT
jgi:fumarate hydratase, class II